MTFQNETHALRTGMLTALLIKHGLTAAPEMDYEGNYTDVIVVEYHDLSLGDQEFRVQVLP